MYSDQAIGWAVVKDVTRQCTPGEYGDGARRFLPTATVARGKWPLCLTANAIKQLTVP